MNCNYCTAPKTKPPTRTELINHIEKQAIEITRLRDALKRIALYGGDDGICPYGCDTPDIARATLEEQ